MSYNFRCIFALLYFTICKRVYVISTHHRYKIAMLHNVCQFGKKNDVSQIVFIVASVQKVNVSTFIALYQFAYNSIVKTEFIEVLSSTYYRRCENSLSLRYKNI